MSDEQKETGKEPAANPPENAVAAAPEVPPIPAGEFGQLLESAKIAVKHLGPDGTGVEMIDVAPADLLRAGEILRDKG